MTNFNEIKRQALDRFFARTNSRQREAIFRTEGAVLIVAGAGSGKTTVLCNRIANLILFGQSYSVDFAPELSADDEAFLAGYVRGEFPSDETTTGRLSALLGYKRVQPWRILAVTFTNKAAAELKERLALLNAPAGEVWASTFHSCCVRILRRNIDLIGYKKSFTIYDSDDSLRLVKACMKDLNLSDKTFNPKQVQGLISRAKDQLIPPAEFSTQSEGGRDFLLEAAKSVYGEYQKRLKGASALDFDDIIVKTIELLEKEPEVCAYWQNKFMYIMVDEYQDTNLAQYRLVSLLAGGHRNLCVVGDEDQSIYRFRGATIENIRSFEQEFSAATVMLEQNYRSTENILEAANCVIKNNTKRKLKNLWSDVGRGEKISIQTFSDEQAEAYFIANTVLNTIDAGGKYAEHVVLYRTNAQSRTIELALTRMSIPYRIIGGTKFYDRKEVKDMLAYMSVLENPSDWVRMQRIINTPKRNIGEATQAEVGRIALGLGITPIEVMERAEEFATLSKKAKPLQTLAGVFHELMAGLDGRPLDALVDDILAQTGYRAMLDKEGEEGDVRLQNIKELKSSIIVFLEENPGAGLTEFLEQAALIADMDSYENGEDRVVLMTMHSAKGLEFDTVFLAGAEENIFPSYRSMADPAEIEEERRLAYVAITRARKLLYITHAKSRLLFGQTQRNRLSRFIGEIPEGLVETKDNSAPIRPARSVTPKVGYLQAQGKPAIVKPEEKGDHSFAEGDRVAHKIFGQGTVLSATLMGNDTLLEIAFDRVGTKKIMANFAKVNRLSD